MRKLKPGTRGVAPALARTSPIFFERMEPRILLSADALSGLAPADPFGDNDPARNVMNAGESAGYLLEIYAANAGDQDNEPIAIDQAGLLDTLRTNFDDIEPVADSASMLGALLDSQQVENRREVVFVDAATPDYQQLLAAFDTDTPGTDYQVFVLQSDRDGIEQISEILAGFDGIDALHLVSHGNQQGIQLGTGWLDQASIDRYATAIGGWSAALDKDADLLIYGCNLAAGPSGQQLVTSLAELTTADVAASDDLTGATRLGGDWELEYVYGDIETAVSFAATAQQAWSNVLAVSSLNPSQDSYIDINSSTSNYGSATSLIIDRSGGDEGDQRALLQFDLSFIASSSTINSADLVLEATATTGPFTVYVYEVTQAWNEGTVTWDTAPTYDNSSVTTLTPAGTGQHSFDLTALVQDWVDGSKTNFGIMLGSSEPGTTTFTYDSYEGTNAPRLVLDYTNAAPVAQDDSYSTLEDVNLVVSSGNDLLDNDSDADGNTLTAEVTDGPDNGTLVFAPAGLGSDTNLTNEVAFDHHPRWSPDGSKIAFTSESGAGGDRDIYVMNADGTGVTALTTDGTFTDEQPVWSPDGSMLAITSNRDGDNEIFIIDATDGSVIRQLTSDAGADQRPTWSPDGSQIAWTSDRGGDFDIWVANADGSGVPTRLTSAGGDDTQPVWSPDGSKILFTSLRDGNENIYVMDADGNNQNQLTSDTGSDRIGGWSPDGSKIFFTSDRSGNYDIWVMDADGSNERVVEATATDEFWTEVSPDGTTMLTMRGFEIYSMPLQFDGTFTYVPDAGFSGVDSFSYVANDGSENSNVATASITVNPDIPPMAQDDSYTTDADTVLTLAAPGVLANDSASIATPGATLEYIAQQDTDGNNTWEDTTGVAGYDFDFSGSDVVRDDSIGDAQAGISAAYVFGSGAAVTPNLGLSPDLFADLPGNPTDAAASFEFWIRPTDASGSEIIFDVGNGVDSAGNEGASLRLNGSLLEWVVWDDNGNDIAFATRDISAEIASGKFIQVVATIDPNDPATTVSLSINGGPSDTDYDGGINDWESPGESPSIGDNDGFTRVLNTSPDAEFFQGEIAAFRFYESVLSAAEIQKNFDSMYFSVVGHDATSTLGAAVTVNGDGSFSYDPGALFDGLAAGATVVDTFDYTIEDTEGSQDTATVSVTVTGVNDAPTATNLSSTSAYNEGDASVPITDIVVSDVDTGEVITATLTLVDTATGSLSTNDGAIYTPGTGVWSITGSVAQVNTALANLVFNPLVNNDVDTTIDVSIDDGNEDGGSALTGTINLDVTPANDAPTATNLNSTSAYNEGDASVAITDIVVSDVDTGEVITATLTLVDTATGSLSANDGATYTPGTGIWTITGSVAQVNTALANLVFNPTVNNDIDTTIDVSIDDGSGPLSGTINLDVTPVNNAPTATNLNSTSAYNEGDASVAITDIVVSDVDTGEVITATLTLTNTATGILSTNDGAIYTPGTGVWSITGSVAQVNTALANLVFFPALNNDADTTIDVDIDDGNEDGGGALTGTINLDVTPVNDPPTATNLSSTSVYTEGDASVAITDIVVSDVDTGEVITATLTLADTATGSLSANDGAIYTPGTGVWSITGSVAQVNTALANLVFFPALNNDVDTTIDVDIDDGSGPLTGTIDLDVTPVNDAPTATNLNSTSAYTEGAASVAITDIVVSDVDTGEVITATLTLVDTATGSLSANDGATYTPGTGVWSITGSVTQVNTALANLVFNPLVNNTVDTTIDVDIDDGSGPLSGTINLDVSPANDAPTATGLNSTSAYDEGDASVALNDIVITDTDAGDIVTATLTLVDTATGSLSANDGASYDAATGVWSITGTVAQVNTALANLAFIPNPGNNVDSSIAVSIDDGDEDGSGPLLGVMNITLNPLLGVTAITPTPLPDTEPPETAPPTNDPVEPPAASEEEAGPDVAESVLETPVSEPPPTVDTDPNVVAQIRQPDRTLPPTSDANSEDPPTRTDNRDETRAADRPGPTGAESLLLRLREQIEFYNDPLQLIGADTFITRLNDMREELISETANTEKVVGSSLTVTAGLSVGYVVWLARSGVLLSSALSSLPAWRFIDPLPVLAGMQTNRADDDEESLESLVADNADEARQPETGREDKSDA
ncbi:MAG: DUF4347 domain-containing protein [Gammaproteobacteria bacterium]|nr:DUF4347 domain-containing protein [Gammaproteobacteria bacterium]